MPEQEAHEEDSLEVNEDEVPEDLAQAMKEAVEAVEAHERHDDDDDDDTGAEVELEVEASGDDDDPPSDKAPKAKPAKPKVDPREAVTEAIIKAKQELEAVLEQTQREAKSLHDKWLRAAADLQNYKKRAAKERDSLVKFANEGLLKELLPVFDDLDRTLQHVSGGATEDSMDSLLEGVRLVHKKFLAYFEKQNVTTFESAGTGFDPGRHEAVQQVHSEEVAAGGVAAEIRRGFFLGDRLLRPAMVTVSMGAAPQGDQTERTTIDPAPEAPPEEEKGEG